MRCVSGYVRTCVWLPELCNLGWGPLEVGNPWLFQATGLLNNLGATGTDRSYLLGDTRGYVLEATYVCSQELLRAALSQTGIPQGTLRTT